MDSGSPVDLIMFDFSKAFDVVCHGLLLEKLRLLGIQGQLLGWLQDFLVDRTMQVLEKTQQVTSEWLEVECHRVQFWAQSCSLSTSITLHQT